MGGVLALVLSAAVVTQVAAQPRGELRVGVSGIPAVLDPATQVDGATPLIARQVFDTLVQYREGSSDLEPGLALRWSPSRDGLTWTFTLRDGVRFHDGTPLTPQHVVGSFERQMFPDHVLHPNPPAVWARLLRGAPGVVKEVHVLDPRTVQVRLVVPYASLLTVLAHPGFSVIHTVPGEDGATRWHGTGPFRLDDHEPGRVVLTASPWYWGNPPRAERIVFLEVGAEQGEIELEGGRLDVWIPAAPPPRMRGALSVPGWQVGLLALQTEKPPFSDKRVRQAVAAALDPALVAVAVERVAVPLQSFLPPGVWGRREGWPVMAANPVGARRLLRKVGLPERISTSLLVSEAPGAIDPARLAEAVRASLGPAGISVQIRAEPPDVAVELVGSGDHEMVLTEGQVAGGDPHLFLYPLSTSEGAVKGPGVLNLSFYRNPQLDNLLIRASQLAWRPERLRLYERAQVLLADELPWIPLYVRLHWAVARPEVRDLRLHPSGHHPLARVWLERFLEEGVR